LAITRATVAGEDQPTMLEEAVSPFSFVAGMAILTNACAIMQNGATTRYNLGIAQWRDFRASLAARDDRLTLQYVDPGLAVALAEPARRQIAPTARPASPPGQELVDCPLGVFGKRGHVSNLAPGAAAGRATPLKLRRFSRSHLTPPAALLQTSIKGLPNCNPRQCHGAAALKAT
jgi:hypothetical protein